MIHDLIDLIIVLCLKLWKIELVSSRVQYLGKRSDHRLTGLFRVERTKDDVEWRGGKGTGGRKKEKCHVLLFRLRSSSLIHALG